MRFGGNVPKTYQRNGYVETEYLFTEPPFGSSKEIDIDFRPDPICPRRLASVEVSTPTGYFDRVYPDGTRKIGTRVGASEQVVWTINPDGSATYARSTVPLAVIGPFGSTCVGTNTLMETPVRNVPPGFVGYTYRFSPEGMKVFRAVASLYPNGFVDRSKYNEFPAWPQWIFPFEKGDSDAIRSWILNMSPAEVLALYYTLVEYNGDEQNVYNGSWYYRNRKFVPEVTPEEFKRNGFWSLHQEMLIRAIWDLRTDLRKVRDPNTGQVIDGIIDYKLFQMPKRQGGRAQAAQAIAGVALGLMTLGASTGLQATLSMVDTAKGIMDMKSQADKMRAMQEFSAKVVGGYQAASDARNLIVPPPPPPKLTPAEEALSVKAEGKTPPAVTVTQGGTFPWLLAAGAAAALLLS